MFTLAQIADPDAVEWATLYLLAVARGAGCPARAGEERIAACDELVALTVAELPTLGALATTTGLAAAPAVHAGLLAGHAARLLRALDRALAAHGRDCGYDVDAWRAHARDVAWVTASRLARLGPGDWPLHDAARRAAEPIGRVIVALPRDRLAVPEQLAEAIGPLLAIYAATVARSRLSATSDQRTSARSRACGRRSRTPCRPSRSLDFVETGHIATAGGLLLFVSSSRVVTDDDGYWSRSGSGRPAAGVEQVGGWDGARFCLPADWASTLTTPACAQRWALRTARAVRRRARSAVVASMVPALTCALAAWIMSVRTPSSQSGASSGSNAPLRWPRMINERTGSRAGWSR